MSNATSAKRSGMGYGGPGEDTVQLGGEKVGVWKMHHFVVVVGDRDKKIIENKEKLYSPAGLQTGMKLVDEPTKPGKARKEKTNRDPLFK
jgi:hypothetical protein